VRSISHPKHRLLTNSQWHLHPFRSYDVRLPDPFHGSSPRLTLSKLGEFEPDITVIIVIRKVGSGPGNDEAAGSHDVLA
jgi:hypothetical protein